MLRVDLGCGPHKPDGFIGVDIFPGETVDIVADLNQGFPFEDHSVDELRAHDFIEHLPDRLKTMNEIWRVCKPGAIVDLFVPSSDGRGAFQDPTHVSFWNINSFLYYSIDSPQYLELCHRYGFRGAFKIISLDNQEYQDQVIHVKAILKAIKIASDSHWHPEIHHWVLQLNYGKVADFYEQRVESDPDDRNYYLLGLAHLLNLAEEAAQSTWLWVLSEENDDHLKTQALVKILEAEAGRQVDLGDLELCRMIRRYIYEFAPELTENLIHLVLLSAALQQLTLDDIEEWDIENQIKSNAFASLDPILVTKVEAEIARLHFNAQINAQSPNELSESATPAHTNSSLVHILKRFDAPYKLNLGCGDVKFRDWINLDSDPTLNSIDLLWDIRQGLPFDPNSCHMLYIEQVLEHLPADQGIALLKECRRVLVPGGVLRMAMPSLDILLKQSSGDNWRDQDWLSQPEFQHIQTRAEMLNISFRRWANLWLCDREELHRRLKESGFTTIRDVEWGSSEIPEFVNRETRKDSLLICEAEKK